MSLKEITWTAVIVIVGIIVIIFAIQACTTALGQLR